MTSADLHALRTKLRAVNVEYSALVRAKPTEDRFVRMSELRAERRVLMDCITRERGRSLGLRQKQFIPAYNEDAIGSRS